MPARTIRSTPDHSASTAAASTSSPRSLRPLVSISSTCARASRALSAVALAIALSPPRRVRTIPPDALGKRESTAGAHEDAAFSEIADGAVGNSKEIGERRGGNGVSHDDPLLRGVGRYQRPRSDQLVLNPVRSW